MKLKLWILSALVVLMTGLLCASEAADTGGTCGDNVRWSCLAYHRLEGLLV